MDVNGALADWTALLGAPAVLDRDAARAAYAADTSAMTREVPAALRITDAACLPAVVAIAHRHRVPLYPISTGRNWGYGSALPARNGCVIVDLSALQRIVHFDPDLGAVTVEPGVTQGMLADFLREGGHDFLVPVTGAGPTCSLLANALERGYGITPFTDHFGAVTDLEAVLPDGSLYRTALREAGGDEVARLFKWGIGPYSTGLFTQSGFGIVTRITLLLARRPEVVKACLFSLKDDALLEPAVERVRAIVSSLRGTVGGINLMNRHRVLAMSAPFPADRLDGHGMMPADVIEAMGRQYQIMPWTGFGSLYGTRRMVAAAQREMRARLKGVASRVLFLTPGQAAGLARLAGRLPGAAMRRLSGTASTLAQSLQLVAGLPNETALPLAYWRNPQGAPPPGVLRHPSRDGCGLIWYAPLVPMKPATVRRYVDLVREVAPRHGMEPLITLTSVGETLFDSTVPLLFDRRDPTRSRAAWSCHDELLRAGVASGFMPYRVGINSMETLLQMSPEVGRFHARLKSVLDPHGILAPGRYVPDPDVEG